MPTGGGDDRGRIGGVLPPAEQPIITEITRC